MRSLLFLTVFLASSLGLHAGESMLTTTYQPLNGLRGGGIRIVPVACHDWYRSSGMQTQISLISAKNVPPTNNAKEATQDLNLASVYGVRFSGDPANVNGKGRELSVYAPGLGTSNPSGYPPEQVFRASLECLRLALPPELRGETLTLKDPEKHAAWLAEIVKEFNAHDRTKVFFISEE